ncbi:MAG: hypothetical protein ABWZ78_06160 [Burkholderiaceae bacterium]
MAATARNIDALRPAAEVVERARRAFEALGFRSHPGAGHAFSIEADAVRFEATFNVRLSARDDGGMRVASPSGQTLSSLPLDALPPSLRPQLDAVVFSEPPAFGPGQLP